MITPKILRIYPKLPPEGAGMEWHIKNLSLQQTKMGLSVLHYFCYGEAILPGDIKIPIKNSVLKYLPEAFFFFCFHFKVLNAVKKSEFTHLHLLGDWSSFIWIPLYRRLLGNISVTCSIHGEIADYDYLKKVILFFTLKKSNSCYATGYSSYLELNNIRGSFFQHSGVSHEFLNRRRDDVSTIGNILFVGSLISRKNVFLILRVAKKLPFLNFSIVGDGPLRSRLMQYCNKHKIANVNMLGSMSKYEVSKIMDNHEILLHPSFSEGTPTVVLEAMSVGIPVICSDAGGISNFLINNRDLLIVENSNDDKEYTSKILALISDIELRKNIINNSLERSKRFRWDYIAKNITKQTI
jgi:glycosyltransferase involved in cell wall biosynthesis